MPKRSEDYKEIFSPAALRLAWERYVRSAQREAKDYLGIRAFRDSLDTNLHTLSKMVLTGEYSPSRPPKYFKCKSSGMQRTITILPLMDSLVFQAIADNVAAKAYPAMVKNHDFVFGSVLHDEVPLGVTLLEKPDAEFYFFQPWQLLYKKFADSVNKAVKELQVEYKFETDITGFYDNIPHYNLLEKTAEMAGTPDDVLDLLAECLNYWSGTRDRPTPGVGIPQATVASHFFANLFLHDLDDLMKDQGLPYYRYMDDMRIYGYGHDDLHKVLVRVDRHLKQHALSLNAKKTAIEEITADREAETLILFQYNAEQEPAAEKPSDEFFSFAAQDGAGYEGSTGRQLSEAGKELIALCYRDIEEVKERIAEVATAQSRKGVDFDDRAVQRDFMSLGFRFRQAVQILRSAGRKRQIRKVSGKKKLMIYEFARGYIRESLDVMVPRYRDAFPDACTDGDGT